MTLNMIDLDKLREKTDKEKRNIVFLSSFCITALIFFVWSVSFKERLNSSVSNIENTKIVQNASPLSVLKNEFSQIVNELKAKIPSGFVSIDSENLNVENDVATTSDYIATSSSAVIEGDSILDNTISTSSESSSL